jgi:hypothetical protein
LHINYMDTKEQRLAYGEELEREAGHYLRVFGFHADRPERTPKEDMELGDLRVKNSRNELVRIDCKRGWTVSQRSVDNFQGEYYLFADSGSLDPNDWWLVPTKVVKAWCKKAEPFTMKSGDTGYSIALEGFRTKYSFFDMIDNGMCQPQTKVE